MSGYSRKIDTFNEDGFVKCNICGGKMSAKFTRETYEEFDRYISNEPYTQTRLLLKKIDKGSRIPFTLNSDFFVYVCLGCEPRYNKTIERIETKKEKFIGEMTKIISKINGDWEVDIKVSR